MWLNAVTESPRRRGLDRAVHCLAWWDTEVLDARAQERGRNPRAGYGPECGRRGLRVTAAATRARVQPGTWVVALEVCGAGFRG